MDGTVDGDEQKENVEPKQRRKRTREAPRCYSRSIEEGTNARGYPKSKKRKTARDEHTPSASQRSQNLC